ncbi:MAG: hypothetical protein ACJLS3_00130 [Erythrobacter sp.]
MTMQSEQIAEQIARHRSKAEDLMMQGSRPAAALELVKSEALFDKWKEQHRAELARDCEQISSAGKLQLRRLEWFKHLEGLGYGGVPTEVSSEQRVIFSDCTEQPRSWAEAKAALDKLPEFQMGDPVLLPQKIKACEDAFAAASCLLTFFADYLKAIEGAKDDPSKWNRERIRYHDQRIELVSDFNEKMRAAYDC